MFAHKLLEVEFPVGETTTKVFLAGRMSRLPMDFTKLQSVQREISLRKHETDLPRWQFLPIFIIVVFCCYWLLRANSEFVNNWQEATEALRKGKRRANRKKVPHDLWYEIVRPFGPLITLSFGWFAKRAPNHYCLRNFILHHRIRFFFAGYKQELQCQAPLLKYWSNILHRIPPLFSPIQFKTACLFVPQLVESKAGIWAIVVDPGGDTPSGLCFYDENEWVKAKMHSLFNQNFFSNLANSSNRPQTHFSARQTSKHFTSFPPPPPLFHATEPWEYLPKHLVVAKEEVWEKL